jgi:hypothetical protein
MYVEDIKVVFHDEKVKVDLTSYDKIRKLKSGTLFKNKNNDDLYLIINNLNNGKVIINLNTMEIVGKSHFDYLFSYGQEFSVLKDQEAVSIKIVQDLD